MKKISRYLVAAVLLSTTACNQSDDKNVTPVTPALQVPATYNSANYEQNTTGEASVRTQLTNLINYMKTGQTAGTQLQPDSLQYYFSGQGNPSLSGVTGPVYRNLINNVWFPQLVAQSGGSYDPKNGDTATVGGLYAGRLFDAGGKEVLQEVEKGLYAAALYNHLNTLIANGPVDTNTVDKMVHIWGASPAFPNTSNATKTPTPDAFSAVYTARRDKADGTGLYTRTRDGFIKLRAAVAAGRGYEKAVEEALAAIRLNIEKGIMATVVNYSNAAVSKLSQTAPAAATISGGLHDLGESIGFIHGFKGVPAGARKISDGDIDALLVLFNAPANGKATVYKFVTAGTTELPKLEQARQKIKTLYGFTDAEMEDFKQNWVSVQGR